MSMCTSYEHKLYSYFYIVDMCMLRLRFLTQYTLLTYFSKPVEDEIFNTLDSAY